MAFGDREIEVKTPVSKEEFLRITKYLRKKGKFVKSSKQIDIYYTPFGRVFLKPKNPFEWLSLRERNERVTINYKHWYPEGTELTTHCDEYETEVGNKKQFQKLLSALRFEELVTVEKTRQVFVKDELEISLDKVKSLGYFVEIESLKNSGGIKRTRKRILDFAKKLGMAKLVNVPGGYACELMRRKGFLLP